MHQEVATYPESIPQANPYTYKQVKSTQDVATTIENVVKTRTPQVALVSIVLQFESTSRTNHSSTSTEQSARYFLEAIRPLTRRTDVVMLSGTTCYFILLGANMQGGKIVQERLWDALLWRIHNATEGDVQRPYAFSIGHSAYPIPHQNAHQCIMAAQLESQSIDLRPEKVTRATSDQVEQETDLVGLARQLGVPYLSLLPRTLPARLRQLISPKLAHELRCYPLGRERDTLTVAMSNPQDRHALDRLHRETGLRIFPVLAPPQELQGALEQCYTVAQC